MKVRHLAPADVLDPAVNRVWGRYLRETRAAAPDAYPLIEERAWRRLVSNLAALGAPLDDLETEHDDEPT